MLVGRPQTTSLVDESRIQGRDAELMLSNEATHGKSRVSVIPIAGIYGRNWKDNSSSND